MKPQTDPVPNIPIVSRVLDAMTAERFAAFGTLVAIVSVVAHATQYHLYLAFAVGYMYVLGLAVGLSLGPKLADS